MTPEQLARQKIDAQLVACGWTVQDYQAVDFSVVSMAVSLPPLAEQTRIVLEIVSPCAARKRSTYRQCGQQCVARILSAVKAMQ